MKRIIKELLVKSKIFAPIGIAITISIFIITLQSIHNSKESVYALLEQQLIYEVQTVLKVLSREELKPDSKKNKKILKEIIDNFQIGKSGSLHVLDKRGKAIVNLPNKNTSWGEQFVDTLFLKKKGTLRYTSERNKDEEIIAFDYHPGLQYYIVATVSPEEETKPLVRRTIVQSVLYGVIIFVLLSLFVFFLTSEKLHRFLKQIEDSNEKLLSIRKALEHSESKFKILFNSSTDEIFVSDYNGRIIEVNEKACHSLEYSREELLSMKLFDLKTKKYMQYASANIKQAIENGYHTYETEHVTKAGRVIPFEMKSRIMRYEGKNLILSIARNISDRKAFEKKVVQTSVETEIKERKRLSADLHDGLGPILSTIKLYSDLIKKGNFKKMSLEEAVVNIDELVEMAISTTKEISNNITPNVLDDFGLAVAINEFCSYVNRTQKIQIEVDTDCYQLEYKGLETTILYQTVKELINNTLKHANAKNIKIQLKNNGNQVILYYRDDGSGFDFEEKMMDGGGLGLNNIVNKIKTLKGSCDFNSRDGKGMFILINVKFENLEVEKN